VWRCVKIGPTFGRNFGLTDLRAVIGAALTNTKKLPSVPESALYGSESHERMLKLNRNASVIDIDLQLQLEPAKE
jgi:hypothetical protein